MNGMFSLQIFVRQKNRSSARAPENSIKVCFVTRLHPLSALKYFRLLE